MDETCHGKQSKLNLMMMMMMMWVPLPRRILGYQQPVRAPDKMLGGKGGGGVKRVTCVDEYLTLGVQMPFSLFVLQNQTKL